LANNLFLFRRFDDHLHHYQEKIVSTSDSEKIEKAAKKNFNKKIAKKKTGPKPKPKNK
jgi:hypothetical protein